MPIGPIASKFRRALRNGTGATFALDQLQEMAGHGILRTLAMLEAEELCPVRPEPVQAAPAATENEAPSASHRPAALGDGRAFIAALAT